MSMDIDDNTHLACRRATDYATIQKVCRRDALWNFGGSVEQRETYRVQYSIQTALVGGNEEAALLLLWLLCEVE